MSFGSSVLLKWSHGGGGWLGNIFFWGGGGYVEIRNSMTLSLVIFNNSTYGSGWKLSRYG